MEYRTITKTSVVGRQHAAFSLLELLTVLGILTILMAAVTPGINSLLRSLDLTATGESVHAVLHNARQAARAKNVPVEIRFYRKQQNSTIVAVEAYAQQDDGSYQRVGAHNLEEGRGIITLKPEMTTFFQNQIYHQDPDKVNSSASAVNYQFFRFRPDGSTELDESQKWYFTLLSDENSDRNFYTIQVNPHVGTLKTYRP